MKTITVFCGSSLGNRDIFKSKAVKLGKAMVERKIDLVYGGAKVGLMGVIADAVLEAGGKEWEYHASTSRVMWCDK